MTDYFKNACRLHLQHAIYRYLMVNADGRWDGAEKAQRHREMCQFYAAVHQGHNDPSDIPVDNPEYLRVHADTQLLLTDRMDDAIGFPLVGRPDYESLTARFFDQFHALAIRALSREENPIGPAKQAMLYRV